MKTKIQQLSEQFHSEIIDIREHLHKNPELSFQEFKTADFIEEKLILSDLFLLAKAVQFYVIIM